MRRNNVSILLIFLALKNVECYFTSLEECESATNVTKIFQRRCSHKLPSVTAESKIICREKSNLAYDEYEVILNRDGIISINSSCLTDKDPTCMEIHKVFFNLIDVKALDYGTRDKLNIFGKEFKRNTYVRVRNRSEGNPNFYARETVRSCAVELIDDVYEVESRNENFTANASIPSRDGANIVSINLTCSSEKRFSYDAFRLKLAMNTSGVERLNFGGCNSLKLLQAEDIPILPTLTHLYLGNSNLETRDLLKFADRVPTLKVLKLTGNSFIFIQNIILTSFKHLQELDMSGTNFYFEPNEKIFETKIEILRASSIDIRCTGIYIKRYLSLVNSKCKEEALNTVLKDIIPQMKSLRYLLLSDNNITSIPPNSFQNMLPNGVVILKNNSINYTSTLNVDQLSLLDLSKNSISNLDDLKISGKIDKLNLEFNNIQKWKSRDIFSSVKHLNISNNDIRAFDRTMIESLSTLEVVDLGNNPFDCNDCSLYDFQQWLVSQKRTQVTNLGRPYMTLQCQHPTALEGRLLIDAPYNSLCTVQHRVIMGTTIPITILVIVSAILIYIYRFQLLYITQLIRVRNRAKRMRGCERKFNYDAFVSYCSADRAWVHDVLMDTLENDENKYALCLHERDFRLGAYIQDNVAEGMEQSRNVILVLSPSFVKSKWCQWELNLVQQLMFEDNPDFLILLELEKLRAKDIPSTLRLMMSTRTYLECPRAGLDMSNFWTRLKLALGKPLRITPLTSIQFTNSHNQEEDMY